MAMEELQKSWSVAIRFSPEKQNCNMSKFIDSGYVHTILDSLLFTHKNGAISVTERSCTAPILKGQVSVPLRRSEDWYWYSDRSGSK